MTKILLCWMSLAACAAFACSDNARWVDPFIGTLANGHTTPAACRPFGMVQAGPDTGTGNWDHCSGYKDWDRSIIGFSQTHLSGTGCSDLGDIRILPFSSDAVPAKCAFRKETETASPGAYAVTLHDEGVRVEATATEHVGVYRFAYGGRRSRVLVDPQWGIISVPHCLTTHVSRASIAAPRPDCVEGWIEARHWAGRYVAFTARFSKPAAKVEQLPLAPGEKAPKFVLDFDLAKDEPLLVKVALSATDVAHANLNLEAEMSGWDFDRCRAAARAAWNEILSRMDIDGTDEQKRTAYTALYHLCTQPNNVADANGDTGSFGYPAQKVVPAPGGTCYSTFSFWDTFRAANPLYTILTPEKIPEFVNSLVFRGETAGFLPRWQLWGTDNGCMIGAHAVPLLVDAYLKGFPGDWERVYVLARKTLTTVVGWKKEKEDWPVLDRYGYYPFDLKKRESASSTMEAAYDDWCMARFAEAMGKKEDAAYFAKRAQGWTNLFDAATGFVRGRDSKGAWREPFDPLSAGHGKAKFRDFTEGNAYQYTFHVLQDPERLIALCGGREKFVEKLDGIFAADARVVDAPPDMTGMVGQYSQGNEPSHHIAYFYALAGRPDRTAEIVRHIVERYYTARRDGLCGNEDCGQMSAWYLFAAMGFYPFNPASGEYVLGAPQLPRVELKIGKLKCEGEVEGSREKSKSEVEVEERNLATCAAKPLAGAPGGRPLPAGRHNKERDIHSSTSTLNFTSSTFTILARNLSTENKYVKSVTLNGKPVTDGKIRHADIVKGGELVFEMTDVPNRWDQSDRR